MNQTLEDIKFLMACLYIWHDGAGVDAYDRAEFCTLAERYGFHIDNVDEAFDIKNLQLQRLLSK